MFLCYCIVLYCVVLCNSTKVHITQPKVDVTQRKFLQWKDLCRVETTKVHGIKNQDVRKDLWHVEINKIEVSTQHGLERRVFNDNVYINQISLI